MTVAEGSRWLLAGAVLAVLPVAATHAADEAAVVRNLAGYVLYTSGVSASQAHAFMNVRSGDMFAVPAGVKLKVVYLQGRRQEVFSGPADFTVGVEHSIVRAGAPPRVSILPEGVPQKLLQTRELVQIARLARAGGTASPDAREPRLTPQQQAEVLQARETYARLRAATPADDISPELYLYAVLQDNQLFGEMKDLVADMARRQPDNPDIAVLRDYVNLKAGVH